MSAQRPLPIRVLELWWREELDHDDLLWAVPDGVIQFAAACSDFFAWGSGDCEEIDEVGWPLLLQTVVDIKAVDPYEVSWAGRLYAARRRQMRPQGAYYRQIPPPLWPLFDACGAERETGYGNPYPHPAAAWEDGDPPSNVDNAPAAAAALDEESAETMTDGIVQIIARMMPLLPDVDVVAGAVAAEVVTWVLQAYEEGLTDGRRERAIAASAARKPTGEELEQLKRRLEELPPITRQALREAQAAADAEALPGPTVEVGEYLQKLADREDHYPHGAGVVIPPSIDDMTGASERA